MSRTLVRPSRLHPGTMDATVKLSVFFHAVSDDPATAGLALRGQDINGAFEAVEGVRFPFHRYFERLGVFVSATFALSHTISLSFAFFVFVLHAAGIRNEDAPVRMERARLFSRS